MHNATDNQDSNDDPNERKHIMYRIPIWDPSLPAFASGVAHVYGTADDIRDFMDVRRSTCRDKGDNVIDAYETWRASGFVEVPTINIAYGDRTFVVECPVIGNRTRGSVRDYDKTYMNIWGFPYQVHIGDGTYERLLVKDDDRYVIVEKTHMRGMTLDTPVSGRTLVSSSWGEMGVIDIEDAGTLRTTMFLVASVHDNESDALDALSRNVPLSVEALMSQIVADG